MAHIEDLQKLVIEFRDKRNWKQFHHPKDLAIALALEAAELLEPFRWLTVDEQHAYVEKHRPEIGEELADILYWVLLISYDLKINIADAHRRKIKDNDRKYPVKKASGRHSKYTEYQTK